MESLHFTALALIQEMPEDEVGDNLDVKLKELKGLAKQIDKQQRKPDKLEYVKTGSVVILAVSEEPIVSTYTKTTKQFQTIFHIMKRRKLRSKNPKKIL